MKTFLFLVIFPISFIGKIGALTVWPAAPQPAPAGPPVTVQIDRSKPVGVSRFETGVTHTQHSLDPWGAPDAIVRGKELLRRAARCQNQHPYTEAELMALTPSFGEVARQIRANTSLPIWWAEYYGTPRGPEFVAAQYASIMRHMLEAGSSVALLWSPQDSDVHHALFSDTRKPDGGRPFPHYAVFKAFHDHFGPGTRLYRAVSSSPDLEALASAKKILLINKRPNAVEVSLDGRAVRLVGYEVRVVDTTSNR